MVNPNKQLKNLTIYAPDIISQGVEKKENFIVAKHTRNRIAIIPDLSDATIGDMFKYQAILDFTHNQEALKSEYCSIQKTCLTRIVGTNLIADNNETISYLCRAGARSIVMQKLERLSNHHGKTLPTNRYIEFMSNRFLRQGIEPTEVKFIVDQYCHKYGGRNYFGWAEFVFVQNFLKNRKFNKKPVGEK